ncbi:MAG: DUF4870 domain-containing protein [Roseiflexus sp.]|nr:DUF4870 domain-containing protein [Roseiflexus sp.]MCS7291242.1 DUF4870 domain-containing protein [Roseiflexus sp.]MDW8145575.1 DUF4870 domain-containing protein [Roseiflexaceae bacterium]MDW8232019.1 DUF4870 domain-containing protein [Roseiflexaceae bacterium]
MVRPDEDERLTAAIAHASIIANAAGLTGLALTVILWATQRQRSRFVRAHIVQALVYQAGTLLGVVLLMLLWSGCLLLSLLPAALRPDLYRDGTLPDTFWVALFGLILPIGYGVAATLYALYGAYQVYCGNRFAYPLAGRLVARDLEEAQSSASAPVTPPQEVQPNHTLAPLPDTTSAPPLPSPGSPVAAQQPASAERLAPSTAAPVPPVPLQTRTVGEEVMPASSVPSSGATLGAASPSPSEPSPAAMSDEGAPISAGSAPPIPAVRDIADVVPMQDALDQGPRATDRAAVPSTEASSTGQPPEER